MTLAFLALMSVIAARMATRIDLLREQSSFLSEWADAQANASTVRAQALFRMTTQRLTPMGFFQPPVTLLAVDGRSQAMTTDGIHQVSLSLQDERGLLSLNSPDRPVLARLLTQNGIPESSTDHLIDTLEDYTDTDSLRRINGAEAPEYEALGLPPPRNDWLASPQELRQVIGWRDFPNTIDQLLPLLSSRRDGFYNANTAPRAVLAARFPRADPEQIERFLARRIVRPFASSAEARFVTGLPFSDDIDLFFPGMTFRMSVSSRGLPVALEYTVRLTPAGAKRPWQILDARTVYLEAAATPTDSSSQLQQTSPAPAPQEDETPQPEGL